MPLPTDGSLQAPPDPVESALRSDLASPRLRAATDDGRFGVHAYQFPIVVVWIRALDGRLGMRLDCVEYPRQAPSGRPWDLQANCPLALGRWPVGSRADKIFRKDWSPSNGDAPYLACDRVALRSHPDWARTLVGKAWNPAMSIADYLDQVYEVLLTARLPAG